MWQSWSKFAFIECEFRLLKIRWMRMWIRGIYFISRNVMHWFRSIKMIVTIRYFLKSVKSRVHILVQCNTWLSKKLYWTLDNCSLCDRLDLRKKQVWLQSLAVCAYEISRRTRIFFNEFAFKNKALKTFVKFQIRWKRSKFEHCGIRIWTLSHPAMYTTGVVYLSQHFQSAPHHLHQQDDCPDDMNNHATDQLGKIIKETRVCLTITR